jgi:hypothetical protein
VHQNGDEIRRIFLTSSQFQGFHVQLRKRENFFGQEILTSARKTEPGKTIRENLQLPRKIQPLFSGCLSGLRFCCVHAATNILTLSPIYPWRKTMADASTQPTPPPVIQTVVIKEKKGWGLGTKILLGLIAIVVVVAVLAALTLSVAVIDSATSTSFPYTTSYRVSLPDSEPITIGNIKILVITMGNEVDTSIDGNKERLAIGQERVIRARQARISALGFPLMDTDFQIVLKYIGPAGNNALFDMRIMTSRQVPEMLLRRIIPAGMGAQPI